MAHELEVRIPDLRINGAPLEGLPHILSLSFKGLLGEVLLHHLEERGVMVSTGSACHAKWNDLSETLKALKVPHRFRPGNDPHLLLTPQHRTRGPGRRADHRRPREAPSGDRPVNGVEMRDRDIVIRYGEIGIKGKNRSDFEKQLVRNVKGVLRGIPHGPVNRPRGRVIIRDAADAKRALDALTRVPGVMSASAAYRTVPELDAMERAAASVMAEALAREPETGEVTFKVETVRAHKAFPMNSMEISARLGGYVIETLPRFRARMKNPDILLQVEVRAKEVLLSGVHVKGPGGLPIGSTGKVMTLLSGGIDSPVAAWMAMRRGARAAFINYHSYPFIPHRSLDKVKSLVKILARYQGRSTLYVTPFSEIQVAIKRDCPEGLRTLLYRRMMMRLAVKAAEREGALALVTGECLGQVASQTLENIGCIGEAAGSLPVLRPLVGFDKYQVVERARWLGTYETSIRPEPDSCTVFAPRNPRIRGTVEDLAQAETAFPKESLLAESLEGMERIEIDP